MNNPMETLEQRVTARSVPETDRAARQQPATQAGWHAVALIMVLDVTGSMDEFIRGAVQALVGMIDILASERISATLGCILFRDEKIGEAPVIVPLGVLPEELKEVLRVTQAQGGGDEPESSLPALSKAMDLMADVSPNTSKMIIHTTDAGCHDPEQDLTAASVRDALVQSNTVYFGCTPRMEPYLTFANATGGTLFEIRPDLDAESFQDILKSVVRASVNTIRQGQIGLSEDTRKMLEDM